MVRKQNKVALLLFFTLSVIVCLESNWLFNSRMQQRRNADLPADFNYNKVVTIVAFDRFMYFRQCLDALRRAWGAEEYTIIINVDGPPADTRAYDAVGYKSVVSYSHQQQELAQVDGLFKEVLLSVSDVSLGVHRNKKRAVEAGFNVSDFVIVLEDDIVLDQDALQWFEWHVTSGFIFQRPEVGLASCFAFAFPFDPGYLVEAYDLMAVHSLGLLNKFFLQRWHTPWGWATWRSTWEAVGDKWMGRDKDLMKLILDRGWFESQPMVARCNNVGVLGVHSRGATGKDHTYERLVTSSAFPSSKLCQYTEIPRLNSTPQMYLDYPQLFQLLRTFNPGVEMNVSLLEWNNKLREWKQQQPNPSFWDSTC